MARKFRLGPCRLLSSASITDPLATWHDHGWIRGNVIDRYADNYINTGKADQTGRTPRADAVYISGSPQAGYTIPLLNYQIDEILRVFPGAIKVTNTTKNAIGISTPTSTLTPRAFALVPEADYNEAMLGSWWNSDHVRYIEEGILHITDSFTYNLPDGDDILESKAYVCEVMALADADTNQTGGIGLYRPLNYIDVTVGTQPEVLAITPDQSKVLVTNNGSNNVTIIDLSDNSTTTVSVGILPRGIAITPDGSTAVVANSTSDNITLIDLSDNSTTTVAVGDTPRRVAITTNGLEAIVTNLFSNNVSRVTLSAGTKVDVTVGTNPEGVTVTPDGLKAIVCNNGSDNVSIITLSDNSIVTVAVGDSPNDIAITPDGNKAVVTNGADNTISVITLSDNSVVTYSTGVAPIGVDITSDGLKALTANFIGSVSVITLSNGSTNTFVTGTNTHDVLLTDNNITLFVAERAGAKVAIYKSIFDA